MSMILSIDSDMSIVFFIWTMWKFQSWWQQ